MSGEECGGGSSVGEMRFFRVPNSAGSPALSETPVPFGPRKRSHCPQAAILSSTARHTIRMLHHAIRAVSGLYRRQRESTLAVAARYAFTQPAACPKSFLFGFRDVEP